MSPLPLLLLVTLPAALPPSPDAPDGACPTVGWCHLPRWVPGDLGADDAHGQAVDLEGDTAVIGAPGEDAVYVYHRDGGQWTEIQRLDAPAGPGSEFGAVVVLDGDQLAVGAPEAIVLDQGGAPVNGGQVHLFERVGLLWTLASTLQHTSPNADMRYGSSLDVEGDRMAVATPRYDSGTSIVGCFTVYRREGDDWIAFAGGCSFLTPFETVALDEDRVIVGAPGTDDDGTDAGSAWWYRYTDGFSVGYISLAPVSLSAGDRYGERVAGGGGYVAVAAPGDSTLGAGAGRVRLYRWNDGAGAYDPVQDLYPCGGFAGNGFGLGLDLEGERLAVGAPAQETLFDAGGKAHVYALDDGVWELENVMTPGDGLLDDAFGAGLAVDGEFVLAGAPGVDAAAPGAGAAYLASLQPKLVAGGECPCDGVAVSEPFGSGKPGSLGVPELGLAKPPVVGGGTTIVLSGALVGAQPFLVWGHAPGVIPFDDGELYVADPHVAQLPIVGLEGTSSASWGIPADPALCGAEFALQGVFLDPGAGGPWHTAQSNGLVAILGY